MTSPRRRAAAQTIRGAARRRILVSSALGYEGYISDCQQSDRKTETNKFPHVLKVIAP
jgi:hypothetical protein